MLRVERCCFTLAKTDNSGHGNCVDLRLSGRLVLITKILKVGGNVGPLCLKDLPVTSHLGVAHF